ncbi:MAG: disulfide bond formation protein B [Candidatus Kerfeldbacteria bacterium]|nr:disulfide bond formation protein B [Candidatus Kerfeldbacteria bacterium]
MKKGAPNAVVRLFGRNGLQFAFVVALVSMLGSLFYSEIAKYTPCELCWYQRILMYPQTLLLFIALIKKDLGVTKYTLWMSLIGALVAGYHYLLQLNLVPAPCSAVGYSAACSQRFVMEYGYITIPMMAFTGFVLILLMMVAARRYANAHVFSKPDGL